MSDIKIVDNIFVIDNVINNQFADRIEQDFLYNESTYFYFTNRIAPGKYGFGATFDHNNYDSIVYEAAEKTGSGYTVKDIIETRAFITLPSQNDNGEPGPPHIDDEEPHNVCLYYVNDVDGDTVFFDTSDNNAKIIGTVSPKKNRVVIFPGHIYHANYWPTTNPRAIINIGWTAKI
jgi:hypothetical protein